MLKKLCKSISLLLFAGLMVSSCAMGVCAASERGSISITMRKENGDPLPGGELTLYYVAKPDQRGVDWFFVPVNGFASIEKLDLTELSPETADKLYEYTTKANCDVKKKTIKVGSNGKVKFDTDPTDSLHGLRKGLYLVVQTSAAKDYKKISPFLVTVPCDGHMEVDATPKSEPGKFSPGGGGGGGGNNNHKKPPLIQTGQLNWPVPVLAGSGILLFMLGWIMVFSKRERYDA